MSNSTINHPALLGLPGAFGREAARIQSKARSQGLFDLPVDADGPQGHTATEAEAVRSFEMLGQAFNLPDDALAQWHLLLTHEAMPPLGGALLRGCRGKLPDLMLRARTFAMYQDREGRGAAYMAMWRRAAQLQDLLDCSAQLLRDLERGIEFIDTGAVQHLRVLRVMRIDIDARRQCVDVCCPTLPDLGDHDKQARRWIPVMWPARWVRFWLTCWLAERKDCSLPMAGALGWLLRDPQVRDLIARQENELFDHPALPRDAMLLSCEVYWKAGALRPLAELITWAWQCPDLYAELIRHARPLVRLMPAVHRQVPLEVRACAGLRELRSLLLNMGLTAAGWRWLTVHPAPVFRNDHWLHPECLGAMLWAANSLAAAGPDFAPPQLFINHAYPVMVEAKLQKWPADLLGWFLRSAWDRCEAFDDLGEANDFLRFTYARVWYWMTLVGWRPDVQQRRGGWRAIERAWRKSSRGTMKSWPIPFERIEWHGLVAIAIGDGEALWEEGAQMNHCIERFLDECLEECFLAFSVRRPDGKRMATFSLTRDDAESEWTFHACSGPSNQEVRDARLDALIGRVLGLTQVSCRT